MTLEKKVIAVGFIDGTNKWHCQVVECMTDPVILCGPEANGFYAFFEDQARHLQEWCKSNNFEYYYGESTVKFKMKVVK